MQFPIGRYWEFQKLGTRRQMKADASKQMFAVKMMPESFCTILLW
jgi:hypothetical protein